jgi:hypothetical protein
MFEWWRINKRKLSRYTSEQILSLAQEGNSSSTFPARAEKMTRRIEGVYDNVLP